MNNLNVKNSWNGLATQKGLDQTTQKITSAIEKSTGKIAATLKDGTKTISEATRKAITNASGNQSPTVALAVSAGLAGIAQSTAQTADYLRFHPGEMKRVGETMTNIGGQLSDLTDCAKQAAENGERLWGVVGETKRTAEYLGNNFSGGGAGQSVPVNNSFGRVVGSFADL